MSTSEQEYLNDEQEKILDTALTDLSVAAESMRAIRKSTAFGRHRETTPLERDFNMFSRIYEDMLRTMYKSLFDAWAVASTPHPSSEGDV